MKKRPRQGDPLDNLSRLVTGGNGGSGTPPSPPEDEGMSPEQLEKYVEQIVKHAASLAGPEPDVFDVQEIIEAAADHMRFEIREMLTEEDDG